MTTVPATPASSDEGARTDTATVDLVLTGRVMCTGAYIAGLLAAGLVRSAATPHSLAKDLWPDVDPAIVQEIFDRGCATGWMGHELYQAPKLRGAELRSAQKVLSEMGHLAMGPLVARSQAVAERFPEWHPADGEDGREH
jgi:hypothetical protein